MLQIEIARGFRWLGMMALVGLTGCSPSTFLARRMMDAPNRVPAFVKPEGRVWLSWANDILSRFPTGTNRVGEPSVDLRWVVVEPADYGWTMHSEVVTRRDRKVATFRMGFRFPKEGLPPAKPAMGTAYVLHGYGVDLETMFPWAIFLAESGWRAVLVDLPGHGLSGGRQVTFGIREVEALMQLRRSLESSGGWGGTVVTVGHSMGATVALGWQSMDAGIAGTVALGPYSEFVPAALRLRDDYARWVPRGWVRGAANKIPGLLGVNPEDLDTLSMVRGHGVRAMLVASANDVVTPPEDCVALQGELGEGSAFLIVGNATHETLPYVFPQHGRPVREWLDGVVRNRDLSEAAVPTGEAGGP